jgi:hypothetical protein
MNLNDIIAIAVFLVTTFDLKMALTGLLVQRKERGVGQAASKSADHADPDREQSMPTSRQSGRSYRLIPLRSPRPTPRHFGATLPSVFRNESRSIARPSRTSSLLERPAIVEVMRSVLPGYGDSAERWSALDHARR